MGHTHGGIYTRSDIYKLGHTYGEIHTDGQHTMTHTHGGIYTGSDKYTVGTDTVGQTH